MRPSPGVLISACLFGDGAAAAICSAQPAAHTAPWQFGDFDTLLRPDQRDILRFENRGGKLRNLLERCVPREAAKAVEHLWNRLDATHTPPERALLHAGGRDVLDEIELRIPGMLCPEARAVLAECGNLSSPSVLFGLKRFLADPQPSTAQRLWLCSFGAGFAAHSCTLGKAD